MSDKGISFSAPMVRALLAGTKTQTRRLLKGVPEAPSPDSLVHEPRHDAPYFDAYCGERKTAANPRGMSDYWCWWTRDDREGRGMKVPYALGDRLYVRESCLWLAVTDVRVQRLQDISASDCRAEGHPVDWSISPDPQVHDDAARDWYMDLWNSLYTAPGERWEDNPWVVAVGFDVHRGNIDAEAQS